MNQSKIGATVAKMPGLQITTSGYDVLTAGDGSTLVMRVKALMADGWTPLGGVSLVAVTRFDQEVVIYAQAMVKISLDTNGV